MKSPILCGSSLLSAGSLVPRIGSQDARGSKVVALGAGRDVAGADDGEKEETSQR